MKVWLDDKRDMPSDYNVHVHKSSAAIDLLNTKQVTEISLDHDLGPVEQFGNGHLVSDFIEMAAYNNSIPRVKWHIHSANAVEVQRMTITLKNADRYWDKHEGLDNGN